MARHATPTNILEMKGAFTAHPERRRKRSGEPKSSPLTKVSKHLSVDEKKVWREMLTIMPEGVIAISDTPAFEMLCKLIHVMRTDFESMTAAQLGKLETMLARFGMTPSDRTKIIVTNQEDKEDPWADL